MGFSTYINLVNGFLVNEEDLFDYEEFDIFSCKHLKEDPAAGIGIDFCPKCGTKHVVRTGKSKTVKRYLAEILDTDMDLEHEGMWKYTLSNGSEIVLRHLISNYSNDTVWFVGKKLARIDPRYDESTRGVYATIDKLDLINEIELSKVLSAEGIPFNRNSFSIYLLADVF